jgi:hypothetical protein
MIAARRANRGSNRLFIDWNYTVGIISLFELLLVFHSKGDQQQQADSNHERYGNSDTAVIDAEVTHLIGD